MSALAPPDDPNNDPRVQYETVRTCPCGGGVYDAHVWGWGVCAACGTWVNTRRPTRESLPVLYGEGYWTVTQALALCPPLEQRFENDTADRIPQYLAAILPHLPPGARVGEVGCGNARLLHELKQRGHDVAGTEYHASVIGRVAKLTDVPILEGGAERFEPGTFDAIISLDVLEHTHDPQEFLRGHVTLLKPGGVMLLHTPVHDHPSEPYAYRASTLWRLYHINLFSRSLIERLFDGAGLDVVSAEPKVFGWPLFVLRRRA